MEITNHVGEILQLSSHITALAYVATVFELAENLVRPSCGFLQSPAPLVTLYSLNQLQRQPGLLWKTVKMVFGRVLWSACLALIYLR